MTNYTTSTPPTNYTTSTPRTSTPGDIYGLLGVGTDNRGQLLDPSSLIEGAATITLTAPTGFSVAGSPLTGSGTLALSFAAGYALPTTTKQTQWDTAYGWGDHALAGYLDAADIGSAVLAYDANLQAFTTAFTLPTADGTVGQVLRTDGAGNITFVSPATGTVTSVGLAVPTGFSVSGSPVTGSGDLTLGFAAGYALPTTAKQSDWDTAFGWGNHASAGYLLSSTAASTYQPLDADLTAIAALVGTSGLLRKTAADTWSLDTATYLQSGAIGSTVLAYDANLQAFVTAFTLPTADGTSGQVLTTNGAGVISFATPASPEIITTPTGPIYRFTQNTKPAQRGPGQPLVAGDQWTKPTDNGIPGTAGDWIWTGSDWASVNVFPLSIPFVNGSSSNQIIRSESAGTTLPLLSVLRTYSAIWSFDGASVPNSACIS